MFNNLPFNSNSFNSYNNGELLLANSFTITAIGGVSLISEVLSETKKYIAKSVEVNSISSLSLRLAKSFTIRSPQVIGRSIEVSSVQATVISTSISVISLISFTIISVEEIIVSAQYIRVARQVSILSLVSNGIDNISKSWVIGSPITSAQSKLSSEEAYLLLPNGDKVEFEGSVGFDEGSIYWRASLVVGPEAYAKIRVGDEVEVNINGDAYALVIDSRNKSIANSRVDTEFRVEAVSKIAHKLPGKDSVSVTYDVDTPALTIVSELLPEQSIEWGILDWNILANRLSVKNADAVETAQKVAEAAGGVIESKPNGDLVVRYLFPVSPTAYLPGEYDCLSSTYESIFNYSEQDKLGEYYNRVRVSDITPDISYGDFIEYVQEKNFLHAFTLPFDPEATVSHTSNERVTLVYIGVKYEVIGSKIGVDEEILEVINGKCSTKYPIFNLESFQYLYANLGGMSFDPDTNTLYTADKAGYSLVKVVYTTRYIRYAITGTGVDKAQFLLNRKE